MKKNIIKRKNNHFRLLAFCFFLTAKFSCALEASVPVNTLAYSARLNEVIFRQLLGLDAP